MARFILMSASGLSHVERYKFEPYPTRYLFTLYYIYGFAFIYSPLALRTG